MTELTSRQREVYDAIVALIAANKTSPTVREIGAKFGIRPNAVCGFLRALAAKGYISTGRTSRSIRLLKEPICPCCGAKQ